VLALRQTNIVRMLAYSSIAQGGFILMPLAAAADAGKDALTGVITYLLAYSAMNLGAFAVVMAVSRKTRRGDIASFGGLISYAPGLATLMTVFMVSLAGVPPTGGFIAKLSVFRALLSAHGPGATVLAIVGAVNSVIAFGYYGRVMREMWMNEVPDGDTTPVRVPQPLAVALTITVAATLLMGVLPQLVLRYGDLGNLVGALGK
jgi:NADH-quinone oxidoreductase subunit N